MNYVLFWLFQVFWTNRQSLKSDDYADLQLNILYDDIILFLDELSLCLPVNKRLVVAMIGLLQMCWLQSILADMVVAISVCTLEITH